EACIALMHAHQAGVIHRDLKPANLFLVQRADGTRMIKVLDFGVSKSISSTGAPNLTLTKTSAMVGSPIYMSPEQLNSSKDVDGRTDIWALGIILYELIAGRTPFYGESIAQLVNAVLNTEPESMANLNIELPQGLEQVMRKALSKSRDQRYASARELYNALSPYAGERAGSISSVQSNRPMAPTRSMSLSDPPPRPTPSAPTPGAGVVRPERSRTRTALIAVGLIALAGVAALLSRRGDRDPPETTGASMATPSASAAAPTTLAAPAREPSLAAQPSAGNGDSGIAAPSADPAALTAANAVEPTAPSIDAGSRQAIANEPATPAAALAPHRSRERPRPAREPAVPAPASRPEPASSDPSLPNFGGRR
ncbi:MAG TPA: protein kinase, partial [Polyangiales bacterium]